MRLQFVRSMSRIRLAFIVAWRVSFAPCVAGSLLGQAATRTKGFSDGQMPFDDTAYTDMLRLVARVPAWNAGSITELLFLIRPCATSFVPSQRSFGVNNSNCHAS